MVDVDGRLLLSSVELGLWKVVKKDIRKEILREKFTKKVSFWGGWVLPLRAGCLNDLSIHFRLQLDGSQRSISS